MSTTPANPDDVQKLLDNGWTVVMRMCGLGSYYGVAIKKGTEAATIIDDAVDTVIGWTGENGNLDGTGAREFDEEMEGVVGTDDFTPSQLLYRLTEKATTGRIVGCDESEEEEDESDA